MLTGLRWRLSLLYAFATLALLAAVGGGMYALLDYYFRASTDLALQSRLALDLRRLGLPVPADLAAVAQDWYAPASATATPRDDDESHEGDEDEEHAEQQDEAEFDSELAAVFSFALTAAGAPLSDQASPVPGLAPDVAAVRAALRTGRDWRTVRLADGTRIRLFTYLVGAGQTPAVLQLGRTLGAQDEVRGRFGVGLLGLGALSTLLMGAASWWLAGRSLAPARRAWERQQAFVANASHELRTPLTLVRASAEVAQRGLPPTDRRYTQLADILQEADHMSRLVDDLLLLSRLDARSLPLERRPIAVAELLADLHRQVGRLAEAKGVVLEAGPAAGALWGDPARVRQVLLILLDNALAHTPPGGRVQLAAAGDGRWLEVRVTDTGPGIAPAHLPHVFERFYRADAARSSGGAGLGLAIAQSLVAAQGGQIAVASPPGAGATFTVRWPAA